MTLYNYGIHHSPLKILKLYKNKCLKGSRNLDFGGKGYKIFGRIFGQMGIRLIGDGYFYIGRVIVITVFPWQFLVITQSYRYNTNVKLFCCKNHRWSHWRCSVKERVLKNFASNFIKKRLQHRCFLVKLAKFLRTSIFKNTCERLLLQDIPWPTSNIRPCMLHNFEKNRRPKNERRE